MLGSIARRSVVLSSRRSATKTRELRNLRRASRGTSSISARTPTRRVSVSHPTLGGLTERVERVVDTLDSMLKSGPRHLTIRQWQAAQIFRSAYEVIWGAVGKAKDMLYDGDYCIIEKIAGIGHSLERCAGDLLGHHPSKADRTRIGDGLRRGLEELAAKWVPEGKKQTIRTWRPPTAIPRVPSYFWIELIKTGTSPAYFAQIGNIRTRNSFLR